MDYTVSAYFEANRHLAERISEAKRIACPQTPPCYTARLANDQVEHAANKVSEFIEVFTWETRNTDLIRIAFIETAMSIRKQFIRIREDGRWPDPFNGTPNRLQLLDDLSIAFRKALDSHGYHAPCVLVKSTDNTWDYSRIEQYLSDMQRQLQHATFDNLLEAVTYYEKSELLLRLIFKLLDHK